MKYKRRYVLGEGYPYGYGQGPPFKQIALTERQVGLSFVPLGFPRELWDKTVPRYRIILRRVREHKWRRLFLPYWLTNKPL